MQVSWIFRMMVGALCAALVVLPFSIAVGNGLLALTLLLAFVSGVWWQGVCHLWHDARPWLLLWLGYMVLMVVGLAWSPDLHRGGVIISKQWSWLVIPVVLMICREGLWLQRVLWGLSIGLALHLLLCVAQSQGMPLPVAAPGGSSQADATGLIGHISFGLLYGIWAAWLLHLGWLRQGISRYALGLVALWAVVMVFLAQGRSGYLVVLALTGVMLWKLWLRHLHVRVLFAALIVGVLSLYVVAKGPAETRIAWTVDSLKAFAHGDLEHAEARISLWYISWEAWKQSPWLGIGTGGFPSVSKTLIAQHAHLNMGGHDAFAVPHNIYIMEMTRWGPLGLLVLLLWLGQWVRMGWRMDWQQPHQLLVTLSGVGIAVHGLTSQAVEEYHASMYGAMFFAIGLAAWMRTDASRGGEAMPDCNNSLDSLDKIAK